jgi:hypothetical protein
MRRGKYSFKKSLFCFMSQRYKNLHQTLRASQPCSQEITKNPHIFPANLYSPGQHPKKVVVNFTFPGDRMSEKLPMYFLWVNYSLVN